MSYCCADCIYMDLNDENSYGDYWCGRRRKYYPGGDSTCSDFKPRNKDCHISITVFENLRNSED